MYICKIWVFSIFLIDSIWNRLLPGYFIYSCHYGDCHLCQEQWLQKYAVIVSIFGVMLKIVKYCTWLHESLSDIIGGPHNRFKYSQKVVFVTTKCCSLYNLLGLTGWKKILRKVLGRMPKAPLWAQLRRSMQSQPASHY